MNRQVIHFALGALVTVTALGAGMAIRDDGLRFPDGSIQTTAPSLPAIAAVQGRVLANIAEYEFCSGQQTLYSVPPGQRLAIEWISVQVGTHVLADPVRVHITTWNGATPINHPVASLTHTDPTPLQWTAMWHSTVRLYSDGGQNVEISACRLVDVADVQIVEVSFSGHLVEVL